MTNKDQLVDQHIREYEARLKHIDELMNQARKSIAATAAPDEVHEEFLSLQTDREQLDSHLEDMQKKSAEQWAAKGGPMVLWDIVAERLEHLVERLEHHKN